MFVGTSPPEVAPDVNRDDAVAGQRPRKVVILSAVRNRRDITLQCLRSLAKVDTRGLDIRIVLIDDASTDGTPEAVAEGFPDVQVIRGSGDLWCSGAINLGIRETLDWSPDYYLVLNDDTVLDSRFLRAMVETADANEKCVVGALLLLWDEPHRVFQIAPRWDTWYGGWRHLNEQTVWTVPKTPFEVNLIVGNCGLFPARAFIEEGLFATDWLPHFGDSEFTPRLKKRGWKLLIDPRARVFNQPNENGPRLRDMSLRQLYRALWSNYNGGHNLRNRFVMYWLGAPNHLLGFAGFCVFLGRVALQAIGLRAAPRPELPLIEEYSQN
jgi:GT2 family glycosyltransferase